MSSETSFKKYVAEAMGTFCLIFLGTGSIIVNAITHNQIGGVGISLVFGLIVLAMIYSIGPISGAHMNPAVTIGFLAVDRLDTREVPHYLMAQACGALLASGALHLLFPNDTTTLGATFPSGSVGQSFLLEFLITLILMFVVMGVAHNERAEGLMAGVAIGATVALEAIFAGPISGCSMNPIRSIAPALISGQFQQLWIYCSAPFLGSIAGARLYTFVH
jgi:MIP family channel proteins